MQIINMKTFDLILKPKLDAPFGSKDIIISSNHLIQHLYKKNQYIFKGVDY